MVPFDEFDTGRRGLLELDVSTAAIFARSPITLLLLVLGGGICAATYRWQRGEADRYSPLVLLSIWIGAVGGATFLLASLELARTGSDLYPWSLLRLSRFVLVVGAATALLTLLKLLIRRSEERGRFIALCACCWCGSWLLIQQTLIFSPPVFTIAPDSIELPTVQLAMTVKHRGDPDLTVVVEADGTIRVGGEQLADSGDAALSSALARLAQRMPPEQTTGAADGLLTIVADARAPYGAVATLLGACFADSTRIWKIRFLVQRELLELPGGRESSFNVYLPVSGPGLQGVAIPHPRDLHEANSSHVMVRTATDAAGNSTARYEFAGEQFDTPHELMSALLGESGDATPSMSEISAPGDLPWQAVASLFDEMNVDADGDVAWSVGRFALLE